MSLLLSLCAKNGTPVNERPSSPLRTADPSTSSQGPGRSAPLDHGSDHRPGPSSRPTNGQLEPRTTPAAQPPSLQLQATEQQFQWPDELADALSVLPAGSEFIGRFSIVADPAVSNIMRARMFADHLRAKAVPISCAASFFFLFIPTTHADFFFFPLGMQG